MSTRRLLFRNLSPLVTRELLTEECAIFGAIRDVYFPTDPQTRRPRSYAFVEFAKLNEAETCYRTLNNTSLEGSVMSIVYVEDKKSSEEERADVKPVLSRLPQAAPVAPAPPVNPNTELYRYNQQAGEFGIDASGRLTRKRQEERLDGEVLGANETEGVGIGGGLLRAVRGQDDAAMLQTAIDDETEFNWESVVPESGKLVALLPSQVIDFNDI